MSDDLYQKWQPSAKDAKLFELADRYHREAEAFDRMVCTGPVKRWAGIMPATYKELGLINANARKLHAKILREASELGISSEEMRRAIARHPDIPA